MKYIKTQRKIETYTKAVKMQLSSIELKSLSLNNVPCIDGCFDIEYVRACFGAYLQNKIDKEYFSKWCIIYSLLIRESYELCCREDIAYDKISEILYSVGLQNESPIKSLAEIEIHNEVLIGKREADYEIAADCEIFCTGEGYNDDLVDMISINHKKKTFAIYRGISWRFADGGYDILGEQIDENWVTRIIFEMICKEIQNVEYRKLVFKEND